MRILSIVLPIFLTSSLIFFKGQCRNISSRSFRNLNYFRKFLGEIFRIFIGNFSGSVVFSEFLQLREFHWSFCFVNSCRSSPEIPQENPSGIAPRVPFEIPSGFLPRIPWDFFFFEKMFKKFLKGTLKKLIEKNFEEIRKRQKALEGTRDSRDELA